MIWGAQELWEARVPEGGRVLASIQGPARGAEATALGRGLGPGEIRFTEFYVSKPSSWAK